MPTKNSSALVSPAQFLLKFQGILDFGERKQGSPLKKLFSLTFFPRIFFSFPRPCLERKNRKNACRTRESGQCRAGLMQGRPMETHGIFQGSWQKARHSGGTFGWQTGWLRTRLSVGSLVERIGLIGGSVLALGMIVTMFQQCRKTSANLPKKTRCKQKHLHPVSFW